MSNTQASMDRRCSELGYDSYGNYHVLFTNAQWCNYCNAGTKYWTGSSWTSNGCSNAVNTLRCCYDP